MDHKVEWTPSSVRLNRRHSAGHVLERNVSENTASPTTRTMSMRLLARRSDEGSAEPSPKQSTSIKRQGFSIEPINISRPYGGHADTGPVSAPVNLALSPVFDTGRRFSFRNLSPSKRPSGGLESSGTIRSPTSAKTSGSNLSPMVVGRRLSNMFLRREKSSSAEEQRLPEISFLDELLIEQIHRNNLVEKLLEAHCRSASLSIRFISGINQVVAATDTKENKAKARKLVQMFLNPSSTYALKDMEIPKDLASSANQGHIDALVGIKDFILNELVKLEPVIIYMKEQDTDNDSDLS